MWSQTDRQRLCALSLPELRVRAGKMCKLQAPEQSLPVSIVRVHRTVIAMGEVAAKMKIMPTGTDVDFNKLKKSLEKALPAGAKLRGFGEEAVAFGLKALVATVVVGDAEGGTEKVEEAFSKVAGVESVSVVGLGRF